MADLSSYIIAAILAGCLAWVIVLGRRDVRALERSRNHCCSLCGYDLRGSAEKCPECGSAIPRSIVRMDVRCDACGAKLQGSSIAGKCYACGHTTAGAINAHVANLLSVHRAQVNLIVSGIAVASAARKNTHPPAKRHMTAREVCIAVRDFAYETTAPSTDARSTLLELEISNSEQIGRVVMALADCGLYELAAEDRMENFVGLFTLDELILATND